VIRLLVALFATVALGLASRLCPLGWPLYDKSVGDVLYAVAAYLALALLLSRWPSRTVSALALAWCLAVESFQATGVPARLAHIPGVRWVLGTTFSWQVVCYVLGVAFALALDLLVLRPARN
jgi:hypothetical protein